MNDLMKHRYSLNMVVGSGRSRGGGVATLPPVAIHFFLFFLGAAGISTQVTEKKAGVVRGWGARWGFPTLPVPFFNVNL